MFKFEKYNMISRIIALPGDTIIIRPKKIHIESNLSSTISEIIRNDVIIKTDNFKIKKDDYILKNHPDEVVISYIEHHDNIDLHLYDYKNKETQSLKLVIPENQYFIYA